MKYEKLRSEFTLIIKLGKQILMMPSAKYSVLWSSLCTYHLFRCSRCTLRFTFAVYIFPSITAQFTLQWDLLPCCITGTWSLKNYNLTSHYEMISTSWDKFFPGRAIISCGFSVSLKPQPEAGLMLMWVQIRPRIRGRCAGWVLKYKVKII